MTLKEQIFNRNVITLFDAMHDRRVKEYVKKWYFESVMYWDDGHQLHEAYPYLKHDIVRQTEFLADSDENVKKCVLKFIELIRMNKPREEVEYNIRYYKNLDWHNKDVMARNLYTPAEARKLVEYGTHGTYYLRKPI